jgi:hypothetical protein
MKRLSEKMTSRKLLEMLSCNYGEVREVTIFREEPDRPSSVLDEARILGDRPLCARVIFERAEDAEKAVEHLGGIGGNIRLDNEPELDELNVFVSNLPPTVTEAELREGFDMFGPVLSVGMLDKTPEDDEGPRRIFGFARFRYRQQGLLCTPQTLHKVQNY